jgi:hypothetical protein
MIIAAMNSVVGWWRPDRELDIEGVAGMFATTMVDGLASNA